METPVSRNYWNVKLNYLSYFARNALTLPQGTKLRYEVSVVTSYYFYLTEAMINIYTIDIEYQRYSRSINEIYSSKIILVIIFKAVPK